MRWKIIPSDIDWMIGLSLMFGLALLLTSLSNKNVETFFIWLNISAGFIVWSGLLELWILVLTTIVLVFIIANSTYKKRFGG